MAAVEPSASARPSNIRLSFSHLGIHVSDLPRMEDFYTRVLGFTVTDRGVARGLPIVFTTWNPREHHQMVLVGGRPETMPYNIINQMSFRVERLEDVQAIWLRVKDEPGVHDLYGTNHGNAWSMYFRDPEGNRIEIFCDSPWYIDQPCVETLDLSRSADEIRAQSENWCRQQPGFRPASDYVKDVAALIEAHTGIKTS
jgi:catechol 2,3-dioxygenase